MIIMRGMVGLKRLIRTVMTWTWITRRRT